MVQVDVSRHELEVAIGREHDEAVPDTQLGEERIDRPDLDAAAAAGAAELGGLDVVGPVGHEQWQRCEAVDDGLASRGPAEALQQFLEHEPRREERLTIQNGLA